MESRTLFDAINAGVAAGYENGFLRNSVVADPLNKREKHRLKYPCCNSSLNRPGR